MRTLDSQFSNTMSEFLVLSGCSLVATSHAEHLEGPVSIATALGTINWTMVLLVHQNESSMTYSHAAILVRGAEAVQRARSRARSRRVKRHSKGRATVW